MSGEAARRGIYVVLWVALVAEAVLLSPPARPDQSAWIGRLLTGQWAGEEPWVVVLFQLMGVWPFVLAALLAPRLRRRPVPLWPFVGVSMAIGAFGLLPGLALGGKTQPPWRWARWLRHPVWLAALGIAVVALVTWGIVAGDPSAFVHAFQTEQFVHVMTFDFVALGVTAGLVATDSR